MNMYPIVLDMTDRLAVVVGGGPVGSRKARHLIDAGARVKLITLSQEHIGESLDPRMTVVLESYQEYHLDRAVLVFAAATPEVNRRVVADAKIRGIWVNSASDPEIGDFIVPATVRRGDLTIAISTGGAAPAMARRIRERIDGMFDEAWTGWLELARHFRSVILEKVDDPQQRRDLFEQLADLQWVERYRREGRDCVCAVLSELVSDVSKR